MNSVGYPSCKITPIRAQMPGDRPSEGDSQAASGIENRSAGAEGLRASGSYAMAKMLLWRRNPSPGPSVELALKVTLFGRPAKPPATVLKRLLEPLHPILNWRPTANNSPDCKRNCTFLTSSRRRMLNESTDCAVTAASFTERALTDLPSDVAQSTPSDVAQSIDRKTTRAHRVWADQKVRHQSKSRVRCSGPKPLVLPMPKPRNRRHVTPSIGLSFTCGGKHTAFATMQRSGGVMVDCQIAGYLAPARFALPLPERCI